MVPYVDMLIICCAQEEAYASRLFLIVQNGLQLDDTLLVAQSLEYVMLACRNGSLLLMTNFKYWLNKIQFEQSFCVRRHVTLFVNWQCVNIFAITIRDREKFFGCVP